MANDDFLLLAQYPRQQVVKDRNASGLLAWASYVGSEAIPASPTDEWIEMRIIAERIPLQVDQYVNLTMAFFQQDPVTVERIRQFLSPWNDPVLEGELADATGSIIGAFMPRFAAQQVTDEDVLRWREDNLAPVRER